MGLLTFFTSLSTRAQQSVELKVAVDTTTVRIGEQLNYTLQIKVDSTAEVMFPDQPIFAPFELLEESPIDTLRKQAHYLYTKKYALIQFDSGNYFLPQQQVLEWFFKNRRPYTNSSRSSHGRYDPTKTL